MEHLREKALEVHKKYQGKIEIHPKFPIKSKDDLSLAYTPGVAEPCKEIQKNYNTIYDYTSKGNLVAIVTNGTAVLGLGDIGAGAGLPVMEGKAVLFKQFGGIDAFPICLNSKDPDEIVKAVKMMEPVFGGINLEDIKAPECFEIEERLKKELKIPVFHDDQHGTAVVALSALINALKIVGKSKESVSIAISGAGAAGIAITKLLLYAGFKKVTMCDHRGIICDGDERLNQSKREIAKVTNPLKLKGTLADAVKGADIFIGVSAPGILTEEMVRSMAKDPIILALANPDPEIMPDVAARAGAKVIATGRSDFPNQVNNLLVFPGVFRGALDIRAREINMEMKMAASQAIASMISEDDRKKGIIIPNALDKSIAPVVARHVAEAAIRTGVAGRRDVTPEMVEQQAKKRLNLR